MGQLCHTCLHSVLCFTVKVLALTWCMCCEQILNQFVHICHVCSQPTLNILVPVQSVCSDTILMVLVYTVYILTVCQPQIHLSTQCISSLSASPKYTCLHSVYPHCLPAPSTLVYTVYILTVCQPQIHLSTQRISSLSASPKYTCLHSVYPHCLPAPNTLVYILWVLTVNKS